MMKNILTTLLLLCIGTQMFGQINSYVASDTIVKWEDMSDYTPTEVIALAGEDEVYPVQLPFDFEFFNNTYNLMYVSTNGNVTFGRSYQGGDFNREKLCNPVAWDYDPAREQEALNPDNFIAVFWDDLFIDPNCTINGTPKMTQRVVGAEPNREFIITYDYMVRSGDLLPCTLDPTYSGLLRAQLRMHEGSNIIEVHHFENFLLYTEKELPTVGVENEDATYANYTLCGTDTFPPKSAAWVFYPSADSVIVSPPAPTSGYCDVSGFNCDTVNGPVDSDDFIRIVRFANIENETSCSAGGYSDYTNKMAVVNAGENYQLDVNMGGPGSIPTSVYAWVDFNRDSVFDDLEAVVMVGDILLDFLQEVPYSGIVQVPADASGMYRMRIKVNGANNPCANDNTGETEDYHIFVGDTIIGGGSGSRYCDASGPNDCLVEYNDGTTTTFQDDHINYVRFSSDTGDVEIISACDSGYADRSASHIIPVSAASAQSIVLTRSNVNDLATAGGWIDWNNNGEFETTEFYLAVNVLGDYTINYVVDPTQAEGLYRVRLRLGGNQPPQDPCGTNDFEVEDYTLLVGEPIACISNPMPANGAQNICQSSNVLAWDSVDNVSNYRISVWYVDGMGNQIVVTDNQELTDTTYTIAGNLVVDAEYFWHVTPYRDDLEAFGCDTLSFNTVAVADPQVSIFGGTADTITCTSSSLVLDGMVADGTAHYNFTWTGDVAQLDNANIQTPTFNSNTEGMFSFTLSVVDDNSCASQNMASINVEVIAAAEAGTLVADAATYCEGDEAILTWTNYLGNTQLEYFDGTNWVGLTTTVIDANNFSFIPEVGVNRIRGFVSAGVCNAITSEVNFTVGGSPAQPVVVVNGPTEICFNETTELVVTNYTNGLVWNTGVQNDTLEVSSKGSFTVTYTDVVNGCQSTSDVVEIDTKETPAKAIIQENSPNMLTASEAGDSYRWFKDGVELPVTTQTIDVTQQNGVYQVIVVGANGCESLLSDAYTYAYVSIFEYEGIGSVLLYPNPNKGTFKIESDTAIDNVEVYFYSGQMVYQEKVNGVVSRLSINSQLESGVYFVKAFSNGQVIAVTKMIVQ